MDAFSPVTNEERNHILVKSVFCNSKAGYTIRWNCVIPDFQLQFSWITFLSVRRLERIIIVNKERTRLWILLNSWKKFQWHNYSLDSKTPVTKLTLLWGLSDNVIDNNRNVYFSFSELTVASLCCFCRLEVSQLYVVTNFFKYSRNKLQKEQDLLPVWEGY